MGETSSDGSGLAGRRDEGPDKSGYENISRNTFCDVGLTKHEAGLTKEELKRKAISLHWFLTKRLDAYIKENEMSERQLGFYGPTSGESGLIEPNIYLKKERFLRKPKSVVIVTPPYSPKNIQVIDPKYKEFGEMIRRHIEELENKKNW